MAESIATAFVTIRPDTSAFKGETTRAVTRDLKATERATSSATRSFRGLGAGALFAGGAFSALSVLAKKSIKEARDQGQILANLRNSLSASGLSWRLYGAEITRATEATKQASAFDDEELYKSLQLLIRGTGDVNKALRLNSLAADVARGRNISLLQSAQLLVRVNAGQVGSLRRLGIQVDKGVSGQKALIQVQRQYAGAAEAYTRTAIGAQTKLSVAIGDTEKAIGRALLPTVKKYELQLGSYLGKAENQRKIQEKVTSAVEGTTNVIRTLSSVVSTAAQPIIVLNRLLGGLENTLKILGGVYLLRRIGLLSTSIGGIGRNAGAAAGATAGLRGSLIGLRGLGAITIPIILAMQLKDKGGVFSYSATDLGRDIGRVGSSFLKGLTNQAVDETPTGPSRLTIASVAQAITGGYLTPDGVRGLRSRFVTPEQYQTALVWAQQIERENRAQEVRTGVRVPGSVSGSVARGPAALTRLERNKLARGIAAGTPSTADDLRLLREQHELLQKNIAVEDTRLKLAPNRTAAKKFADNLANLRDQDNAALSQIRSIEEENARNAKDARDAIARAAAERERRREEAAKLLVDQANDQVKYYALITKAREAAAKKAREAAARARETRLSLQEGALNLARQAADLALTRAGSNQKLIDRATSLERKADQRLIKFYKDRIAATRGLERQDYQGKLLAAQADLAGLKKTTASSGYTLAQLYQEAESQFKLYGSNYGPGRTSLSPQEARAAYSNTVSEKRKGSVTVIQNFHAPTQTSAALYNAQWAARALN